ncbi:unnamed protein product [Microthlaspi erraticum]|uniref:Thioglucosidase n=1 Tax=Microthlaspi erraticum TaxID=1685480 RepID=A0A6D2J8K7_9BRAS|nr:unnamed protein product [Microthlaspi erraticum]
MAMWKFPLMGLLLLLTIIGSPTTAEGPGESANEPVCPVMPKEEDTLNRAFFPKDFLFGTATASYQVEGGVYETNRGRSMWDVYCMKYPNGKRERGVSKDGIRFYHDLIDELNNNGIAPSVTIFHWDIPQILEDEYGGFLSEKIVKDFRDYAEYLFDEFGGKVKNWITINEPWVYAHAGYDVGKKAPGRCSSYVDKEVECLGGSSGNEAYNVTHNLLNAHAEAVEAFRNCEKCKGGKIGIAHCPLWFESYIKDNEVEDEAAKRALEFMLGWHMDPTTTGDYPETMKKIVGKRLPEFTPEQSEKLKGSFDFVGLNYYVSKFPKNLTSDKRDENKPRWLQDSGIEWTEKNEADYAIGSRPDNAMKDMSIYSRGLKSILKHIKDRYGNPEIMIMENGYGDMPHADIDGNVHVTNGTDDPNRKFYLQRHLFSLYEAVCVEKVNVKGYFVWSLLDNFEWQAGYKVRFGLYFVDYKNNLTRHLKKSGEFYRDFLSKGVLDPAKVKNDIPATKTEL